MSSSVSHKKIQKFINGEIDETSDLLAREEPLEIRLGFGPEKEREQMRLAVTMRTPGDDINLVMGFLLTEGIIQSQQDLISLKHCEDQGKESSKGNVVRAELSPLKELSAEHFQRNFYMSSSCGVCGKTSIEAVHVHCENRALSSGWKVSTEILASLPGKLRAKQLVFEHTGGIHAAAAFDENGELMALAEDVGRHNALDKLIGHLLINKTAAGLLLVSGRASFELVQKAAVFGFPLLAAVGAPSSLAVDLAEETGMALVGFLRQDRFNLYSGFGILAPSTKSV